MYLIFLPTAQEEGNVYVEYLDTFYTIFWAWKLLVLLNRRWACNLSVPTYYKLNTVIAPIYRYLYYTTT